MQKQDVKQIHETYAKLDGKSVTIGGWIRSVRNSKTFGFIDLNDGTCFNGVQVIFDDKLENFASLEKLNTGSSILVKGKVVLTPEMRQPYGIHAENIEILSATDESYPLQKKRHSVEFLREIAYLRPRTNLFNAAFRVRSETAFAIHNFFHEQGFVIINPHFS